jgi:hypothetical protein
MKRQNLAPLTHLRLVSDPYRTTHHPSPLSDIPELHQRTTPLRINSARVDYGIDVATIREVRRGRLDSDIRSRRTEENPE